MAESKSLEVQRRSTPSPTRVRRTPRRFDGLGERAPKDVVGAMVALGCAIRGRLSTWLDARLLARLRDME